MIKRGRSMMTNKKISILLTLLIITIFALSPVARADGMSSGLMDNNVNSADQKQMPDVHPEKIDPNAQLDQSGTNYLNDSSAYPSDFDVGSFMSDHQNDYNQKWDPWKTKAAIHTVASSDDGEYFALGGGYLYDNQIHLYRWNPEAQEYKLVWEIGGDIFKSDVLAIDFADTDHNNLTEIVAGTKAGYIYVFEQSHLYDPDTNMENHFELVWQSDRLGRIFDLMVQDTDGDYKKDIIVGTGNTIRFYEYENHSGYPFSEEHWIKYDEVFSYRLDSMIRSIGVVDADSNGLPEVAVGQRSGEIQLLENNGTIIEVEGEPFPLLQDNSYVPSWSSKNTIREPVTDMTGGDLDNDTVNELTIAVQGQGAYILDTFDDQIGVYKLHRPFDSWETSGGSPYTLDYQMDFIMNSSSIKSGSDGNYTYYSDYNVYYANSSFDLPEPLNDSQVKNNPKVRPFRSAAVDTTDSEYTYFDADKTSRNAWATFDFGHDEEASSNGVATIPDLELFTDGTSVSPSDFTISVSQDGEDYYGINSTYITTDSGNYLVEVDPTLEQAGLDYYTYLKVNVSSGLLKVDAIETRYVNNRIYDALSTEVGSLTFKGDVKSTTTGFIGTIDGSILGITHDSSTNEYKLTWNSWKDERFKLRTNLFDLEVIKKSGNFPALIKNDKSYQIDFTTNSLPDGSDPIDYTAGNIYNYEDSRNQEILVSSNYGNIYVYTQNSPTGQPTFDSQATDDLLGNIKNNYNISNSNFDFVSLSLVPADFIYRDIGASRTYDPAEYPYWLFVGQWNGSLGQLKENHKLDRTPTFDIYYLDSSSDPQFKSLTSGADLFQHEDSGQLQSIMDASTWMPKISSADMIGDQKNDLIMTNGRVHLLETSHTNLDDLEMSDVYLPNEELIENGKVPNEVYSDLSYYLTSGYFQEINEKAKGRHYTNANPVNFDGDSDIDLVIGFARYDNTKFNFNQATFGMTYFENIGSAENPNWVERRKAVVNTDKDSGLRSQMYTAPEFLYENYDFGDMSISDLGYHPLYRTSDPSKLLMFQSRSDTDVFDGKLQSFKTQYTHQQSLLAATYPEVNRLDINLQYYDTFDTTNINYGFHIFETWDNREKLRNWTLSMDTDDLDQDGKNEVIVGDFDNNIYVFEHLTNNTFKRAFESFDVNRTVASSETPYAYEDLSGISGDFNRTIFSHIKYLIAGSDLNDNGQKEFIGATDSMLFVFESTRTPSGKIRDDSFQLIKSIDLYNVDAFRDMNISDIKITAIASGDDLTNDGRGELIIASGSGLLIFEMNNDYSTQEIFFDGLEEGKYNMPGNYKLHPDKSINAILTGDFNQNGQYDLAVAGANKQGAKPLHNGFITILEWSGGSFDKLMDTEQFPTLREFNPVTALAVEDSDLDDMNELVIGHERGVEIYEFTSTNDVAYRETISADPSIPYPETNTYKDTTDRDNMKKGYDIERMPASNELKMVYYALENDPKQGTLEPKLKLATSTDNGKSWTVDGRVYVDESFVDGGSLLRFESIDLEHDSNNLWLTFVERRDSGSDESLEIFVIKNPIAGQNPAYFVLSQTINTNNDRSLTPSLYNIYDNTNHNITGLAFNAIDKSTQTSLTLLSKVNITQDSNVYHFNIGNYYTVPYSNYTKLDHHYNIHSLDIKQITDDGVGTNRYAMAFSGYRYSEKLSLDYDIHYAEFNMSSYSQWKFNSSIPTRTFTSGFASTDPTIIQDQYSDDFMIGFKHETPAPYRGIKTIWSKDGRSWNGPYEMIHPLLKKAYMALSSRSGHGYAPSNLAGLGTIKSFQVENPVLVEGRFSGFYLARNRFMELQPNQDLGLCGARVDETAEVGVVKLFEQADIRLTCGSTNEWTVSTSYNPWSNFTHNPGIDHVTDLDIGDSDQDGRSEILVANQKHAVLTEFMHNDQWKINHHVKWQSRKYRRDLTSVDIFDANGNNYSELIIESSEGIVNSYEVIKKRPKEDLVYPAKDAEISLTQKTDNDVMEIKPFDVNDDGTEDFIYTTRYGQLVAIDGNDMSPIWSPSVSGMGADTSGVSPQRYRDQLSFVRDHSTDTTPYAVFIHKNNISLISLSDGSLVTSKTLSADITALEVNDINSGGYDEIVIGLVNRSVITYDTDGSNLSHQGKIEFSPDSQSGLIADIKYDTFTDTKDLLIASSNGYFIVYDGNIGSSVKWNTSYPTTLYDGYLGGGSHITKLAIEDLDNDGYSEFIAGVNSSFAIDVKDKSQMWNLSSLPNDIILSPKIPGIKDVNDDGIKDIIYTSHNIYGGPSVIAVDGSNGNIIWDHTSRTDGSSQLGQQTTTGQIKINETKNVTLTSIYGYDVAISGFTIYDVPIETHSVLQNPKTGVAMGGLPGPNNKLSNGIALADLGYDRPVGLVGGKDGKISVYTFWEGQKETGQDTVGYETQPETDNLNDYFTDNEFNSTTGYISHDISGSSTIAEDLIVIHDGEIRALDIDNLLAGGDPILWESNVELGDYLHTYLIDDVNKDGITDILLGFEKGIILINPSTGNVIWDYVDVVAFEEDSPDARFLSMDLSVFTFSGEKYVVMTDVNQDYSTKYSGYRLINITNGNAETISENSYRKQTYQATGDIDANGKKDLILTYWYGGVNNYVEIYNDTGGSPYRAPWIGPGPITSVDVGDFDTGISGLEILFTYDLAFTGSDMGYDFSNHPTKSMTVAYRMDDYEHNRLFLPYESSFLGISENSGPHRDMWIGPVNADGTDDVIIEGKNGGISAFRVSAEQEPVYASFGSHNDLGVPSGTVKDTVVGGYCENPSYVTTVDHNTVRCYAHVNQTEAYIEYEVTVEFDRIISLQGGGDYDGDGLRDLIVTGENGGMYVVESSNAIASYTVSKDFNNNDQSNVQIDRSIETIGELIAPIISNLARIVKIMSMAMVIFVIRKKVRYKREW